MLEAYANIAANANPAVYANADAQANQDAHANTVLEGAENKANNNSLASEIFSEMSFRDSVYDYSICKIFGASQ